MHQITLVQVHAKTICIGQSIRLSLKICIQKRYGKEISKNYK